tara:strand:- start:919 stop:1158 length:240 start_codon:yes stop_codon:yes gene_type:complete
MIQEITNDTTIITNTFIKDHKGLWDMLDVTYKNNKKNIILQLSKDIKEKTKWIMWTVKEGKMICQNNYGKKNVTTCSGI